MRSIRILLAGAVLVAMILPLSAETAAVSPLPSLDSILHRVLERVAKESDNERQFKAQYIYSRAKQTETRNSSGVLKKKESEIKVHDPTRARSGAGAQPVNLKPASVPNSDTNGTAAIHGKAFEKTDFPLNDELLKRFKFTLVGRVVRDGRPTFVLDFVPASQNLPERNIKDRFINKAAGRAWVDEADVAVVQADLHLSEKVSVGGGLVGAIWKFNFKFNRQRLPDGLWFTRDTDWHLEGREVFFGKIIDYHEERTNVHAARPAVTPTGKYEPRKT